MFKHFPEYPDSFEGPPPAAIADAYERTGYKAYTLTAAAKQQLADFDADLQEREEAFKAELAKQVDEHLSERKKMDDYIVKQAVDAALKKAGAKPNVLHGASALLRAIWKFNIVDAETVVVRDVLDDAEHDLGRAVEWWLSTDEGQAFANPTPPSTQFSDLVRRITGPH